MPSHGDSRFRCVRREIANGDLAGTAVNRQETGGARERNACHGVPEWANVASAVRKGRSIASGSGSNAGAATTIWFAIDMTAQIAHGSFEGRPSS